MFDRKGEWSKEEEDGKGMHWEKSSCIVDPIGDVKFIQEEVVVRVNSRRSCIGIAF